MKSCHSDNFVGMDESTIWETTEADTIKLMKVVVKKSWVILSTVSNLKWRYFQCDNKWLETFQLQWMGLVEWCPNDEGKDTITTRLYRYNPHA